MLLFSLLEGETPPPPPPPLRPSLPPPSHLIQGKGRKYLDENYLSSWFHWSVYIASFLPYVFVVQLFFSVVVFVILIFFSLYIFLSAQFSYIIFILVYHFLSSLLLSFYFFFSFIFMFSFFLFSLSSCLLSLFLSLLFSCFILAVLPFFLSFHVVFTLFCFSLSFLSSHSSSPLIKLYVIIVVVMKTNIFHAIYFLNQARNTRPKNMSGRKYVLLRNLTLFLLFFPAF